mmetsp:Transcript_43999/g.87307  ORF Transcript_43999/g.87307 Transcript_43999/m.87307 type:complete len:201 (+) Transcript_43999:2149-2751(+)
MWWARIGPKLFVIYTSCDVWLSTTGWCTRAVPSPWQWASAAAPTTIAIRLRCDAERASTSASGCSTPETSAAVAGATRRHTSTFESHCGCLQRCSSWWLAGGICAKRATTAAATAATGPRAAMAGKQSQLPLVLRGEQYSVVAEKHNFTAATAATGLGNCARATACSASSPVVLRWCCRGRREVARRKARRAACITSTIG